MKNLLTTLLALILVTPLLGQGKTSFTGMDAQEIRQFLLNQTDSEPAKEMIRKHNISRRTSYVFLTASAILFVASNNSTNPDEDNVTAIKLGTGAGLSFLIAIISGVTAAERKKKAMNMYLNPLPKTSKVGNTYIRNESEIMNSLFKYPTPH